MYQPLDGFLRKLPDIDPTLILEVVGSVPGLENCPRLFYNHLRQVMISLGWHQHSLDACCFLYLDQGAIIAAVCVHVDDVIGGIAQTTSGRRVMKALQEAFTWGKWATEKVEFCGRRYRQVESGISIDQQDYTEGAEFNRTLPARARQVDSPLTPEEETTFRSLVGVLLWLVLHSRPDLASALSLSQDSNKKISNLVAVEKLLAYARKTSLQTLIIRRINMSNACIIAFGD